MSPDLAAPIIIMWWTSTADGLDVYFQNGPIAEVGVNSVTHEALLAIVIDRLRCFQAGQFACPENADALTHATEALEALKSRARNRMARGVDGPSIVPSGPTVVSGRGG